MVSMVTWSKLDAHSYPRSTLTCSALLLLFFWHHRCARVHMHTHTHKHTHAHIYTQVHAVKTMVTYKQADDCLWNLPFSSSLLQLLTSGSAVAQNLLVCLLGLKVLHPPCKRKKIGVKWCSGFHHVQTQATCVFHPRILSVLSRLLLLCSSWCVVLSYLYV